MGRRKRYKCLTANGTLGRIGSRWDLPERPLNVGSMDGSGGVNRLHEKAFSSQHVSQQLWVSVSHYVVMPQEDRPADTLGPGITQRAATDRPIVIAFAFLLPIVFLAYTSFGNYMVQP